MEEMHMLKEYKRVLEKNDEGKGIKTSSGQCDVILSSPFRQVLVMKERDADVEREQKNVRRER